MKNKKGFTLAELLGVLAILAVITVITVPLVNNYIKSSKEKAFNTQIETLENAAREWFVVNSSSVTFEDNIYFLKLEDLQQTEFITSDDIINPLDNKPLVGCVAIGKNDAGYTYEYSPSCGLVYTFEYTGTIETFNISTSGLYSFELVGAGGSIGNNYYSYSGYKAGKGAKLVFEHYLNVGDILYIVVGGKGNTTTGNSSNGAAGAGGGGTFVFRKISSISNSKYQFSKGSLKYEVLGVAAGGNGTCDLSYSSCNGPDGIASPYYSLSNYTAYSTNSTTGSSGSVLGISQFINYDFQVSTYSKNSSVCTGGFGGGSCQNNSSSYGGGWAYYNSSAGSFTIGSNVRGTNGFNANHGSLTIEKIG